jgi:hypothetical protein
MQIERYYPHLNGYEHIQVHKSEIWHELLEVIAAVDAKRCKTKRSKEKTMRGRLLYSPKAMNARFKAELERRGGMLRKQAIG